MTIMLMSDAFSATRFGLLWWPADPANPTNPFIESMQGCLQHQLAAASPESDFFTSGQIRGSLFPYMEPFTQPDTEEAMIEFLLRDEIRQRLIKKIDYLVTFTGETRKEDKGGIVCGGGFGAGGCLGLAWRNKNTSVRVVIWNVANPLPLAHHESHVKGTTWVPALLLPVPIPALTEREACHEMSLHIINFIQSTQVK